MSPSLFLTNWVFCGIAALLLVPLLKRPNMLIYLKGIPIFIGIAVIFLKSLIPYEFSFTQTLASKNILPIVRNIWKLNINQNVTVGNLLLFIWLLIAFLFLILHIVKYRKLMGILSSIPETKNEEIIEVFSKLCIQKQIWKKPKVIQLDLHTGPFLVGVRNPYIVLPHYQMSKSEIEFILQHELEHLTKHHILIKICTEIITVIYWWNPFVWFLRREAIRALEIQADINVIQGLSNKEKFSYLEALITIARKIQLKQKHNLALSFALNYNMLEYRLNTALKFDCFKKNEKVKVVQGLQVVLSVMIVISSLMFTFESRGAGPKDEDVFTINSESDYIVLREDGLYDLYVKGELLGTIPNVPEDLSSLPIHR